jgi:DNA modification methylase
MTPASLATSPSQTALDSDGRPTVQAPLDFTASGHLYATHALHAYAARCPPPLVDWAIERYSAPGEIIFDPMVGSGTTLVEAALLGRRAWGAEIDPLARLIAQAKATPVPPASIDKAREDIEGLLAGGRLDSDWRPALPDLQKWFRADVCEDLSRLRDAIRRVSRDAEGLERLLWTAFSSLIVARTSVANARDLVHSRHHIREWRENPDAPARFLDRLRRMARMMADYYSHLGDAMPQVRLVGDDARELPIDDSAVHCIFFSPPYVSALDYVRAHFFAVAWMSDVLGVSVDDYRLLGRSYVGTDRAPLRDCNGVDTPPPMGVSAIDEVVTEIAMEHLRHGWVVWRYFHDMSRVLREATRVLKDGRHAVLVVCPSNIRKVPVATQELFVELAEHQALDGAQRLALEELHERTIHDRRRVMPYLEASFGARMRTEYVVVFRRVGGNPHEHQAEPDRAS